jgi:hypothetical protein
MVARQFLQGGDQMDLTEPPDPLVIYYVLVLTSDKLEDVTAFQMFSRSWIALLDPLARLPSLPRDVLEPSQKFDDLLVQRIGGMRPIAWTPLNVSALEKTIIEDLGVFVVCFTGEEEAAKRVSSWTKSQKYKALHVTTTSHKEEATAFSDFDFKVLHDYCINAYGARNDAFFGERRLAVETTLPNWKEPTKKETGIKRDGHNILNPNFMSLDRAGYSFEAGSPFIGRSEEEYTNRITSICETIATARSEIGLNPVHLLSLISPGLILAEPALSRFQYPSIGPKGPFKERAVAKALRLLQTQKGLCNKMEENLFKEIQQSKFARQIISERQSELRLFSLATGVFASETFSSVMRLSPGVNHVFPMLSDYARNARSPKKEARRKARRLFEQVQNGFQKSIGQDRINFIAKQTGPLKIISDAPIEWLPIGNLPLGIRFDCSRLNATPGNLLMGLLAMSAATHVHPSSLTKILLVSAFEEDDPLRNMLSIGIQSMQEQWKSKADIEFERVTSIEEFCTALDRFEGNILIFDGHGSGNHEQAVGKLRLGKNEIDVWALRGKTRIPPIVILSACDTHGIDASSQATVGNGFLAIGAQTVLATLLPVGGIASAIFIVRLILRISDFIPYAIKMRGRTLSWSEVVGGMLRMLFASEILDALVSPPDDEGTPRYKIQDAVNHDINVKETDDWYDNMISAIAEYRQEPLERVSALAQAAITRTEAVRYIQLGHPERIIIDDGNILPHIEKHFKTTLIE